MMRELTVYYCSKCGYYGYYLAPQNAVCPHCMISMKALPMSYKNFMRLEYHSRDKMIADQIAEDTGALASVIQQIAETGEKHYTGHPTIAKLTERCDKLLYNYQELSILFNQLRIENDDLQKKNQENEATIRWMHDMIWDMARKLHEVND